MDENRRQQLIDKELAAAREILIEKGKVESKDPDQEVIDVGFKNPGLITRLNFDLLNQAYSKLTGEDHPEYKVITGMSYFK